VQRQDGGFTFVVISRWRIVQRDLLQRGAAFGSFMRAGMIDQNLTHQAGGHAEKVGAALPLGHLLVNQANVSLVQQGRRLERVIETLTSEIAGREMAQLLVHKRYQLVQSISIALFPVDQQPSDLIWSIGRDHKTVLRMSR